MWLEICSPAYLRVAPLRDKIFNLSHREKSKVSLLKTLSGLQVMVAEYSLLAMTLAGRPEGKI
jgi:hypothetical protein